MHKIKEYETHMEMFLSLPKGGVGAEVGVCKGFNSVLLWHTLKPSKMHLCDIWEERPYDTYLIENPELWYDDHSELVGKLFEDEVKKVISTKPTAGKGGTKGMQEKAKKFKFF